MYLPARHEGIRKTKFEIASLSPVAEALAKDSPPVAEALAKDSHHMPPRWVRNDVRPKINKQKIQTNRDQKQKPTPAPPWRGFCLEYVMK